jgi:hypothetical protein
MIKRELDSLYLIKKIQIQDELKDQVNTKGGFSLTLDAWTAINQDAYLGITM